MRWVTAIEQSAEAIFITDTEWIIHYVTPAFERMSGYRRSEIVGQHVCILESGKHDKPFYDRIRETLNRGEVWSGRLINKKKDGTFYQAEATASPVRDHSGAIINYVAVHRDITHEVLIERQLRQALKMEAIGTLAGCHALLYTVGLEEGGEVLDWREVNRKSVSFLHGFETASTDNERYMSLTEALDRIGQKLQIVNEVAALKPDFIPEEQEELEQNEAELWQLSRILGSWSRRCGSQ